MNPPKMTDRPDLLDKAKAMGFRVEPNTGKDWGGKFLLINPDGSVKYTDNTEEKCWIWAMRYADMYIELVEKPAQRLAALNNNSDGVSPNAGEVK